MNELGGEQFQTTSWSLVLHARENTADLSELLKRYWAPIYSYIRVSGREPADAADLTQEFLTEVILGRDLIERATPERGRFRTFLKAAVRNFLIDEHRRATTQRRRAERPLVSVDVIKARGAEPASESVPDRAFDREWAATVLQQAVEKVQSDCGVPELAMYWAAFNAAVLAPALQGTEPPSVAQVAQLIGCGDAARASSMIQTIRRRLRRAIRSLVEDSLDRREELDEEMACLKEFLGMAPP